MNGRLDQFLKRTMNEIPARQLNNVYEIFTKFYNRSRGGIFESFMPRILPTQGEIERKAAKKLAQVLTVIKIDYLKKNNTGNFLRSPSERQKYRENLLAIIRDKIAQQKLERHGASIFLHEKDIEPIAALIEVDADYFRNKAGDLKILRSIMDDPTKLSYHRNELIEYGNEQYTLQHYRLIAEDGAVNNLTMLVDDTQVVAGDKSPSIILVPGIACNGNAFNLSAKYSLARDLAKEGYWVYLFEPRGMGRNKVHFDADCTLDTLIDFDLPGVVDFIYKRSKGKPVILLGHSMGGVISEFMLQTKARQNDSEFLSKIKGLITLGMPGTFDKNCHLAYPLLLWLNYALPLLKVDRVPMDDVILPLTKTPLFKTIFRTLLEVDIAELNFMINPANFPNFNFMFEFVRHAVETFTVGIGFQFLKAIYSGKGITRMDDRFATSRGKYNYTKNIGLFPPEIPSFHFLGDHDPLAPPEINIFYNAYRHKIKKNKILGEDPNVEIVQEPSQVNYFVVPNTKHIDLLYGKTANDWIYPLMYRAIKTMWTM